MKGKIVDWYEITNKANRGQIIAHGYIGSYDSINSKQFVKDFNALAEKHSEIDIDLNSGGGSIFDGNVIYNTIKGSKATVTITVSGIAASMGSILLQSATGKRRAYKNARIMVHKPSGGAYGSAKKMRNTADQLDSLEDSLKDIYVEATGQDEATVEGWLQEGVDKWFTAKQALEAGLIDEIIDGPPVKAPKSSLDPEAMHEYYSNQFKSINNPNAEESMNKVAFVAMLATFGCVADAEATEQELLDKFKNVVSEKDQKIADLQAKLKTQNEERVTALVEGAVASGKILAGQKEQFTALANANYEATAGIIAGMPGKSSLSTDADRGKGTEGKASVDEARADWDFNKWRKEDPRGLEKMRASNPTEYEALKAKQVSTIKSK